MDIIFQINAPEKFTGGSDAYVHRVNQAYADKGPNKEVTTFRLPAGQWVVSAKAVLFQTHKDPQIVHCRLTVEPLWAGVAGSAGTAEDHAKVSMTLVPYPLPPPYAAGDEGLEGSHLETISLMLGVDLKGGGRVRLIADCQERLGFSDIVISAIRVNSLTIETL